MPSKIGGLILKGNRPCSNGLCRTKESRARAGRPDSHPSWRPPAMRVLSAKCRCPLCGWPFPQVASDCKGQRHALKRPTGMRSSWSQWQRHGDRPAAQM
jgi:hypothetical protein